MLPPEVILEDGLSEEEAVAIALWNNALFHSTLSQLGMARGDLIQAGLLTNPQFLYLFGGGDKQIEYVLYLPLEAIFLRKHRITIAERDFCRISQELVQNGLNLVRDVRVAYADLVFAVERAELAEEATQIRSRIAEFSQKRFDAGDISDLEATTARIDELTARADAAGLREQIGVARARLANLLGLGPWDGEIFPSDSHRRVSVDLDEDVLLADALVSRPDLRAAQYAIAAADQQARLSRWMWLRFDGIVDGNAAGNGPANIGPGIRFDVPIFNRNQGGIIRSDWTTDQALHNFDVVRNQVVMDVRTAAAQLRQAEVSLAILQTEVLPSLQEAVTVAENAYRNGGTTYFLALQTSSQYLDAQARELDLTAAEHRALAELERSVGRCLAHPAEADESNDLPSVPLDLKDSIMERGQSPLRRVASSVETVHNTFVNERINSNWCFDEPEVVNTGDEDRLLPCPARHEDHFGDQFSTEHEWPRVYVWEAIDEPRTAVPAVADRSLQLSTGR